MYNNLSLDNLIGWSVDKIPEYENNPDISCVILDDPDFTDIKYLYRHNKSSSLLPDCVREIFQEKQDCDIKLKQLKNTKQSESSDFKITTVVRQCKKIGINTVYGMNGC